MITEWDLSTVSREGTRMESRPHFQDFGHVRTSPLRNLEERGAGTFFRDTENDTLYRYRGSLSAGADPRQSCTTRPFCVLEYV